MDRHGCVVLAFGVDVTEGGWRSRCRIIGGEQRHSGPRFPASREEPPENNLQRRGMTAPFASMDVASWAVDYQTLLTGAATMQEKRDALGNGVIEQSVEIYTRLVARPVCLEEFRHGTFLYGFDYYSHLEQKEAVPLSDTIDDRVIIAIGSSAPPQDKKETDKRRNAWIGLTGRRFGPQYDKGHFFARTIGGTTEVNLFPQRRDLNRGWSDAGKIFVEMEKYCRAHLGTLCFHRPIYLDETLRPTAFDFGVLKRDGELWIAHFDNQEIPIDGGFFQNKILPVKEHAWRESIRRKQAAIDALGRL